ARVLTVAAAGAAFLLPCAAAMPFAMKVGIKANAQAKAEAARVESPSANTSSDSAPGIAASFENAPAQPNTLRQESAVRESRLNPPSPMSAPELKQKLEKVIRDLERKGQNQTLSAKDAEALTRYRTELTFVTEMIKSQGDSGRGYAIQENSQAENEARERRLQELEVKLEQARQAVEQDEKSGVNADQDRAALKMLESQLTEVRGRSENNKVQLERLQNMVVEMQAKLAQDQQSGANTEQDQKALQELKEKLAAAQSGRVEVEPGRLYLSPEGASRESVEKLQQLETQLAQAQQQYSPEHPAVKQLQAQIAELKQQLEQQTVGWKRQREEEMKQRQIELAGKAKISMSDAIQIALQAHPGSVMECALRSERDMIFYNVGIFGDASITTKDASGKPVTNTVKTEFSVLVDATDGHIVKPGEWRKNEQ
ncbi:MAG TPA: hypothetical protein VFO34_13730, partial [Candidatus Acidoferrales bacterium]|nr:hypothetical protein [Candidatus Acidoferrales bacterium]